MRLEDAGGEDGGGGEMWPFVVDGWDGSGAVEVVLDVGSAILFRCCLELNAAW